MPAQAYMLISTKHGKIDEVSERLMKLKYVADIRQVYGPWDIVATLKTKSMADLNDFLGEIKQFKNVTATETLICSDVF